MLNFISRLVGGSKPETRAITSADIIRGTSTVSTSGMPVSEDTALSLSTVKRAVQVLAESVGTMPIKFYGRTESGREERRDHPLWDLLHDEPCPDLSPIDFFSTLMANAVLYGNGYAEIVRAGPQAVQLWPIPSALMTWDPNTDPAHPYVYNGTVRFAREDIFHIRGLSFDSGPAQRLIDQARESFGFAMALERHGSAFFANACRLSGTLSTAGQLSDQGRENLRRSWAETYSGVSKSYGVAVLEEGLTFNPLASTNEAAQYDLTKQAEIYSVCRWFSVDPIFLYEYGRATWNNSEAQTRNFLQFSLNPWLKKIEAEIQRKLVLPSERKDVYAEFVRESIIQMDAKTQAEVWKIGVDGGWLLPDEIRQWSNMKPMPKPKQPEPIVQPDPQQETDENGTTPSTD